jgi:hypothetical protein
MTAEGALLLNVGRPPVLAPPVRTSANGVSYKGMADSDDEMDNPSAWQTQTRTKDQEDMDEDYSEDSVRRGKKHKASCAHKDSGGAPKKHKTLSELEPGTPVEGFYKGVWYPGTVKAIESNNVIVVAVDANDDYEAHEHPFDTQHVRRRKP